nr:integrase, catalytic region, zinc finger, CCHC-type, peptidase aspartic, catalytic [Tanacetum cinerariifolium]
TRQKGKEIAKLITPLFETGLEEDSDHEQAQRDKDMQKNLALVAKYFKKIYNPTNNNLRTFSNSRNKNLDTTPRPKRVKDSAYHKEKMLLCKQAEQGVPLQAEQYDWLADTDEEVDEQELEAHYSYMAQIQKNNQNNVESDDERVTLANLKLDTKQAEFEKYKVFNDHTVNYDKLEQIVDNAWIKHSKDQFRAPTAQDMEILIQICLMPLATKTQNDSFRFVHELKQEMHANLKYVESLKKEIDELESDKAEFIDMDDVILQECMSNDVKCSYLLSLSDLDAVDELQCLYLHKLKECDCLAQKLSKQTEFVSKALHTELLQCFAKVEKHLISLEIALQKYLKAQLQDKNIAISELKKLIEKDKGKSVDTKFDKPSVTKSVPKANVSEGLSKPVTAQTLPQTAKQAIVQLILFIIDSGCTKHMTGNLKLLCNFVKKVYYVEGLNHNLFSIGQFCDADLEVAFRKSTCFVRDLQGNDLLTGWWRCGCGDGGGDVVVVMVVERGWRRQVESSGDDVEKVWIG